MLQICITGRAHAALRTEDAKLRYADGPIAATGMTLVSIGKGHARFFKALLREVRKPDSVRARV